MKKLSILLLIVAICFTGCGLGQVKLDSQEKKYVACRAELNVFLEQYIMIQERIDADVHKQARAAFYAADLALDLWEVGLTKKDYDYTANMKAWLDAKNTIIQILGGI